MRIGRENLDKSRARSVQSTWARRFWLDPSTKFEYFRVEAKVIRIGLGMMLKSIAMLSPVDPNQRPAFAQASEAFKPFDATVRESGLPPPASKKERFCPSLVEAGLFIYFYYVITEKAALDAPALSEEWEDINHHHHQVRCTKKKTTESYKFKENVSCHVFPIPNLLDLFKVWAWLQGHIQNFGPD